MRAEALVGHAAELLRRMLRSAQPPDAVAQEYFRQRSYLGSKERRFVAEVTFAAVRCWGILRWCLARQSAPSVSVSPEWLVVVAMGYLGVQLGNPHLVPAFAAAAQVSENELWENLLTQVGWGVRGLKWLEELGQRVCVLERELQLLLRQPYSEWGPLQWELFSAACSFPEWILRCWMDNPWTSLTPAEVFLLCRTLMMPALPCVRVNTMRTSREHLLEELRQRGIAATPTVFSPVGIRLWERIAVHGLEPYRAGMLEVQEEGSQLVGYAVAPQATWRLWDACAGAGGKTLHLATLQQDRGEIWATDVDALRLRALRQRLRRAGVRSVRVGVLRPHDSLSNLPRRFDAVLIDAPCSGIGTVRRTPTLKWRLSPSALRRHQQRQLRLLQQYSSRVAPGGILVYATCSLMPEENFGVVTQFLKQHPEWEAEPIEPVFQSMGIQLPWILPQRPECLLLPSRHGTDGFFIARFRRRHSKR